MKVRVIPMGHRRKDQLVNIPQYFAEIFTFVWRDQRKFARKAPGLDLR